MSQSQKFTNVDEYISTFPSEIKVLLEDLRNTIKQVAPEAVEVISYNMPAFKLHRILVYYAAHKNHIGFYPGSTIVNEVFKDNLTDYKTSKGTIQFPFNSPLPLDLVKDIVKFRMKQTSEKVPINKRKNKK